MPRSSGTYTLPANALAVSGATISSTYYNNVLNDIATALTDSLVADGTKAMTAGLSNYSGSASAPAWFFTADAQTGLYRKAAGQVGVSSAGTEVAYFSSTGIFAKAFDTTAITSVASATTTDLGAAATGEILITGTTTITGFGTIAAGVRRRGRFDGALTLTHNATSLIIPGGANITTAQNDRFEALSLGSGNWIVIGYQRATGLPIAIASTADYRSNVADKVLITDDVWSAMAEVTLTDGANVSWDMSTGFDFVLTLGGNRTLDNPTNTKVGQKGRLRVVQDGTGSRTLTLGTSYETAGGSGVTLSSTASAEDILYYDVISSTRIILTVAARAVA